MGDTFVTDIRDFLDGADGLDAAPGPARRLALHLGAIIQAASARSCGQALTAVRCRRRPARRPCAGFVRVERSGAQAEICWACTACDDQGVIYNWSGTPWDLAPIAAAAGADAGALRVGLVASPEEYRVLRGGVLEAESDWLLAAARPVPGGVEIEGSAACIEGLFGDVAAAAARETRPAPRRQLERVYARIERLLDHAVRGARQVEPPPAVARPRRVLDHGTRQVQQLRIALLGVRPPIWRRVQVPAQLTLAALHEVVQTVMGWTDSHLHEFSVGRTRYGLPDPGRARGPDAVRDERRVRLADLLSERGARIEYVYDFGHRWQHAILLEAVLPALPSAGRPFCLGGARACPPEDVRGPRGYAQLLATLPPGGTFDPAAFDVRAVNHRLDRLGRRLRF